MKHHTGTHVVNGALRSLFGEHIWQAGSQLGINEARFDFAHYKPITEDEIKKIEAKANEFIKQAIPVEKKVMARNDAERTYGFRLYQGGVPPGNQIRVLNIPRLDVEACGGTHLNNIKEIEKIRILKAERIQDGVNRIFFAAGAMADAYQNEENQLYQGLLKILSQIYTIQHHDNISEQLRGAARIFSVTTEQLEKTLQRFLKETGAIQKTTQRDFTAACNHLFDEWKNAQKQKKAVSAHDLERLKQSAQLIPGTQIHLIIGKISTDAVITAGALISNPGFVVHLYDGMKLVSAASEDVSIDLRHIAPDLGKILGGSGGGRPKLTQCGGPLKANIDDALEKARQLTIQHLKKEK